MRYYELTKQEIKISLAVIINYDKKFSALYAKVKKSMSALIKMQKTNKIFINYCIFKVGCFYK